MKFLTALHLLAGSIFVAQGLALPKPGFEVAGVTSAVSFPNVTEPVHLAKRDDEWTLVLYNAAASGGQCGGSSSVQSGGSDSCVKLPAGIKCVNVKVTAGLPNVAACTFDFKYAGDDCSGQTETRETVGIGSETDGVNINDDVKFVSVGCFAE